MFNSFVLALKCICGSEFTKVFTIKDINVTTNINAPPQNTNGARITAILILVKTKINDAITRNKPSPHRIPSVFRIPFFFSVMCNPSYDSEASYESVDSIIISMYIFKEL
jgi:hypothetical protein